MKIIHVSSEFTGRRAVVALGMFDGVHIGHQALIHRAVTLAEELDAQSVVCTFDRHPLSVLCPEKAPEALLSLHENLKKFERLGAEWALVQAFTPEYGATPPEAFLRRLTAELRVAAIVVGRMAPELGYQAVIVPAVMDGDVVCSSTWIRHLLARGETEHAQRLLMIEE